MSLDRVILHVGPPKTGTTSIQGALTACSHKLLEHGVYYPPTQPLSTEGQPSLAWELLADLGKPVARLSQAYVSWDEALSGAEQAGAQTLLLSSEDFSSEDFDRAAFRHLRRRLGRLPIEVVFALRDPRRLIPSIWSQSVKWGIGSGEELLSLEDAAPVIMQRPSVQVFDYLAVIESSLEPERINLLTVPRKMDRGVLHRRFAQACGLSLDTIDGIAATQVSTDNTALPLRDILLLLSINQAQGSNHTPHSVEAANPPANSIEIRRRLLDLLQTTNAEKGPGRVELPQEVRPLATDLAQRIVTWVKARNFPVSGDLGDVFDEHVVFDERSSASDQPPLPEAQLDKAALFYLAKIASDLENERLDAVRYLLEVEKAREHWREKEKAISYLAQIASDLENERLEVVKYLLEVENAREHWREQAIGWEKICGRLTDSWSWKLTKPLRIAGSAHSIFKLLNRISSRK